MKTRFPARLLITLVGAWRHLWRRRLSQRPSNPRRILIAHQLLLGDTLMLTPLLAKLRRNHPDAEVVLLVSPAAAPLYANRPYGTLALPFDLRSLSSVRTVLRSRSYDWALLPAENRLGWLARACGARWIAAFDGEPGYFKNMPIDEFRPFARQAKAWGELVCELADGDEPAPYEVSDWPPPAAGEVPPPARPETARTEAPGQTAALQGPSAGAGDYALLHVGASSPLKCWPAVRWQQLADWLTTQGIPVVWSCGPGESQLIDDADPQARFARYAGNLDLAQMWRVLAHARMLVCCDTGITHLAHLVGVPSVALYGPGNPHLFGRGSFWRNHPEIALFHEGFPCRDENLVFRRVLRWGEHCGRSAGVCPRARCMETISVDEVISACEALRPMSRPARQEGRFRRIGAMPAGNEPDSTQHESVPR